MSTSSDVVGGPAAGAGVGRRESWPRLDGVDLLRGVVMAVMVLDHTRDFFSDAAIPDLTDLSRTTPALFLTRWVTHFCAPVFAFLAGSGARLAGARGMGRTELARFLATRGLWLIFLELTVVQFGLLFYPVPALVLALVFWSLGGSFVLLSALVALRVPGRATGLLGVAILAAHNLLDGLRPGDAGALRPLVALLLRPGVVGVGGIAILAGYPLLPWFGIVAAGYGFGEVLLFDRPRRRRVTLALGLALTAAFVLLRALNAYGDPRPWSPRADALTTVLSFVNCTKQPPSLLFALMTLGPALVALAAFDRERIGPVGRPFVTLGRVPLFFYLLQWYVIHVLAVAAALARGGRPVWLFSPTLNFPPRRDSATGCRPCTCGGSSCWSCCTSRARGSPA